METRDELIIRLAEALEDKYNMHLILIARGRLVHRTISELSVFHSKSNLEVLCQEVSFAHAELCRAEKLK